MKKLTDIELDAAESEAALLEARRANRRMGDDIAILRAALADSHDRNAELAAQVARLQGENAKLEDDRKAIASSLDGIVEHSGHHMQAERVAMLLDKYRNSQHNVIEYAKERNELRRQLAATLATIEAATHDGSLTDEVTL